MPSPMTALANTSERIIAKQLYIDYCTIVEVDKDSTPGVKCHSPDHPEYYNTVSLKVRSTKLNNTDPNKIQHINALVLQHSVGNLYGQPYTPRVGDLVAILFMYNSKSLVLGPIATIQQEPVYRAPTSEDAKYDLVDKWCQWGKPLADKNMDYYEHPPGRMPVCSKRFHGFPDGTPPHTGRDEQTIWDCQLGHEEPTCRYCDTIDSVSRSGEQWHKIYSTQTESIESYNSRMETHARCGSYLRIESDDENPASTTSTEYSEGTGHVRLGNAVSENDKRGHINLKGDISTGAGTIDIHAEHEEVAFASESKGARISVVNNNDGSVTFAYESIYFDKSAFIRIMKNGEIVIQTPEKITIESTGDEVLIKSPTKITLDAPLVEETHKNKNAECEHGPCSCGIV